MRLSNRISRKLLTLWLLCVIPLGACAGLRAYDHDQLVTDLQAAGFAVAPTALVAPNLLIGAGQTIQVNQEMVHSYEFRDMQSAQERFAGIAPDGGTIDVPYFDEGGQLKTILREPLHGHGEPHFYQRGRLIVVYAGEDTGPLTILSEILGK